MLKDEIENSIRKIATRKVLEFEKYHNALESEFQRRSKRETVTEKKVIHKPAEWAIDKKHNPYYVLKHIKQITNAIFKKIVSGTYSPNKPFIDEVNKVGSKKKRKIYKFQIPDEAVSHLIYKRLLDKNRHRFSSFSYAYRNDRNVHYAVQDIALDMKASARLFVAEFDFKDFFGSINHDYLFNQFNENGFLISEFDQDMISVFLKYMPDKKGIPQGTSISLFLANLVCWELDKKYEKEGLRFARYADDTIIWTNSYEKINKSFEIIETFSKSTGVEINLLKSDGISILSKQGMKSEMDSKPYLEFLGYQLSNNHVSIKQASINKIKKHISYILYKNLVKPLKQPVLRGVRIPANNLDKDLIVAMLQVRRYLYGNLDDKRLRNYLSGDYKRLNFKGLMSFYPLIDDEQQLKEFDKWLISTISNTLKKRDKLLISHGHFRSNQFPFNLQKKDLVKVFKNKRISGIRGVLEVPSFLRIYNAVKQNVVTVGIEKTMNVNSNMYHYD